MRMTKEQKRLDNLVNQALQSTLSQPGAQVDIMDINKMYNEVMQVAGAGNLQDIQAQAALTVAKYRKN